jgi:hypothetical protein
MINMEEIGLLFQKNLSQQEPDSRFVVMLKNFSENTTLNKNFDCKIYF